MNREQLSNKCKQNLVIHEQKLQEINLKNIISAAEYNNYDDLFSDKKFINGS